jgi:anthranilate phosphoribosyltransferase
MFETDPQILMSAYLQRIATGPELSKDLSLAEARTGMQLILEEQVDPVQASVFLIALRMKRESDDENRGVLEALRAAAHTTLAPVDELVDLADPYDGFGRHLPASPFLPAVLAACGRPTVAHGCERLAPKFGVTHRQILAAAGAPVELTPDEAAACLTDPSIGWAYLDQAVYCPALHRLARLRRLIVKRPCLSTLEKLAGPVCARAKTHLVVGYVHKGYERLLLLLARHAGYASALVIRGIEGGVIPLLKSPTLALAYHEEGADETVALNPAEAGILTDLRAVPLPSQGREAGDKKPVLDTSALARAAAEAGLAALEGKRDPTRDSLVYAAAVILRHLRGYDSLSRAAEEARNALDTRRALAHFRAYTAMRRSV